MNSMFLDRTRAARILCAVTFHFNAARLRFLAEVLRSLSEFPVAAMDVAVVTEHISARATRAAPPPVLGDPIRYGCLDPLLLRPAGFHVLVSQAPSQQERLACGGFLKRDTSMPLA
jgi:hypothetical protein